VNILGVNIYQIKKLCVDTVVAAMAIFAIYRVEFIDAEYCNVFERNLTLIIAVYQLSVKAYRSAACGETEYKWFGYGACLINEATLFVIVNALNNLVCNVNYALMLVAED
jgi:hypothetical protein